MHYFWWVPIIAIYTKRMTLRWHCRDLVSRTKIFLDLLTLFLTGSPGFLKISLVLVVCNSFTRLPFCFCKPLANASFFARIVVAIASHFIS